MAEDRLPAVLGVRTAADVHRAADDILGVIDRLDDAAGALGPRCLPEVRFLGCGSSHLGGGIAAALLREVAGVPAAAVVASEAAFYRAGPAVPARGLSIAISRSGATSETLAAVRAHRRAGGGPVVALVCDPDSPLAGLCDEVVAVPEVKEGVVPQTRSVAAVLAFSLLLAGHAAGASPASAVRAALAELAAGRAARAAAAAARARSMRERLVVLGGGVRWWLAREVALKCTEMAALPTAAERLMEYPHGPIEALDERTTVVAVPTPEAAAVEGPVLDRIADLGGQVVRLDSGVDPGARAEPVARAARLIAQLSEGHLLAVELSRARGVDADTPAKLSAFVTLDQPCG